MTECGCDNRATIFSPTNRTDTERLSHEPIWTKKGKDLSDDFQRKCRIAGIGFEEMYDETLRRDTPTCSSLMQHMQCGVASSRLVQLKTGDARGAFLQGKKTERELYFRVPRGLGPRTSRVLEAGSLLLRNVSMYGYKDAARPRYWALAEILKRLGWMKLRFERAASAWFAPGGDFISVALV